jgi:hypothetical protein
MTGALALLMLVPVVAGAQERNPYAGLFGRAPQRTGREFTAVNFRSEIGMQVGQTLDQSLASPEGTIPEGISGGADAALTLDHVGERLTGQLHGRAAYQEYRQQPAFGVPAYDAGGLFSYKLTTRLAFDGSARYLRSPFVNTVRLEPTFFGDQAVYPADSYAALLLRNDTVEGTAGVTSQYSKRSSVSVSALWRQTTFQDSPGNDFESRGFRARWQRMMTRDLGVHAVYGRDQVQQRASDVNDYMNEIIDLGVDYAKALSLTRRTSLTFQTETAMLRENGTKGRFRVNGGVDLQRAFLRTWRASTGVHRTTEFLPGYAAPVLADRAQFGISGYLASKLIFYANADAERAAIGFGAPRDMLLYSGSTRLVVAVSRHVGLFTQYYYYHHELPPSADAGLQLPRISRQSFSVGIQAWMPLVDKDKVNRDTR